MVMERSRNSVRASSADFRSSVDVPDVLDTVAVVIVAADGVAVDVDVDIDVVAVADEAAVSLFSLILRSLPSSLSLLPSIVAVDNNDDDAEEEGTVMQSKEIFFPLPALRAATHNSATSSRLIRVIDRRWSVLVVV